MTTKSPEQRLEEILEEVRGIKKRSREIIRECNKTLERCQEILDAMKTINSPK